MTAATAPSSDWDGYFAGEFTFADYRRGARVLDIGCGGGEQLQKLEAIGCRAFGVEYDPWPGDSGRCSRPRCLSRAGRASTVCGCVAWRRGVHYHTLRKT